MVFSVKDDGIGMSPEFREQVFDSFTREHTVTENGIGGTGLGMAITKNIVDMLAVRFMLKVKLEGERSLRLCLNVKYQR